MENDELKAKSQIPTRTERKKEKTRQDIIKIAIHLFARDGVDSVSMEQIAIAADIARGTLYNYFPVKEAIISDYIEDLSVSNNLQRIQRMRSMPDTRTRIGAVLAELIQGIRKMPDLFEKHFIYRTKQMISLRKDENNGKGLRLLEKEIIHLGQDSGEIRTDIPPAIIEGLFEFVFIEMAQQFYYDPENFQENEVIAACVEVFINGTGKK